MALRTKYSSLDMVRMAKFAKENPDLKPIPLIKAYNDKYPEVTMEQKLANIRNWLDDNEVMAVAEADNECATLPLQRVSFSTAALDMTTEERELKSAELRHTLRGNCRVEVCPNCGEPRPKHYQGEGSCESCAQ